VGKLGAPGKPLYLQNDNEWLVKNRRIHYKINSKVVAMGLGRPQPLPCNSIHSTHRC
jgi:hypothetical protein